MQTSLPVRLASKASAVSSARLLRTPARSALAAHAAATGRIRSASTTTPTPTPYVPSPEAQVTILPNKVRVTTESTPGHFQALGVYIDAGSRFETARNNGASHLLDRMAFKVSGTGVRPLGAV